MTVETLPVPIEVVTPIAPSEAIRLGILLSPAQAFGAWFLSDGSTDVPMTCALGAMILGYGGAAGGTNGRWPQGYIDFVGLDGDATDLPCGHGQRGGWATALVHLNDDDGWSRQRIADWLEGVGL